jgi:hypothetical protein
MGYFWDNVMNLESAVMSASSLSRKCIVNGIVRNREKIHGKP